MCLEHRAVREKEMNQDPVAVNKLLLAEAVPALSFLQALRLAFGIQTLIPSLVALIAIQLLNQGVAFLFRDLPQLSGISTLHGEGFGLFSLPVLAGISSPGNLVSSEFANALKLGPIQGALSLLYLILHLLIAGWVGIAVTNAAGRSFCTGERFGAIRAMRTATSRIGPLAGSLLIASILISVPWGAVRLAGWVSSKVPDYAAPSAFFAQLITSAIAFLTIILIIVVATGWLLSLPAIAIDNCNGADALSRGISYCLSHKLRTLAYVVTTVGIALAFSWVIEFIARDAVWLAELSIATNPATLPISMITQPSSHAALIVEWFTNTAQLSCLYCGVAIGYLLLRLAEDGVKLSECDLSN